MNKKEKLLKYFNDIIHGLNKNQLSFIEKELKDLPPEISRILKSPVNLEDIKSKIIGGEITKITDLNMYFLLMLNNIIMINNSETQAYHIARKFQVDLYKIMPHQFGAINDDDDDDDGGDDGCNNTVGIHNDNNNAAKINNCNTQSKKKLAIDSETNKTLPIKKRKSKYFNHNSNNNVENNL